MTKYYKGFNKDLTCRGFQFEEGKTYECEGEPMLCENGFHACEDPLDCFSYYEPGQSVYREVDCDGVSAKKDSDSKCVCKKITIGAEIGLPGIIKAHVEYVKARCTNENNAEAGKPATAGFRGAATAGDSGAATAGDRGAATAGSYGAATAGSYGAATAGDSGAATAGFRGAATSRGSVSVGKNGIACARGNGCKARGGIGAVLVLAEENKEDCDIASWKAEIVDGERIKADTWYKLEKGEFVEAKD